MCQMATPQRQVRASGFTQLGRQRRPLIARDFERYARSVAAFIRLAISRTGVSLRCSVMTTATTVPDAKVRTPMTSHRGSKKAS